ncbi:MAG: SET domain-containing protein-lysine N-methyltransferase [Pelagibacteraceae bacterium]|nr:SET domain-containing protein-lysine N-methyltransferase [Pelagibacteraceae bacterium]|tara:strand:- start:1419 stop:1889 length:471 start_codon:yes stop_codon:yes gene_type:complete
MQKEWHKKISKVHGTGLFAKNDIAKKKKIIEYIGAKVSRKEGDRRADKQIAKANKDKKNGMVYVFELNSRFDIDGNYKYNNARYINHSCDPNCEVEIINNKIWIVSIKNIKKGEELSYNYGYAYDTDYTEHKCRCKSKNCVGFILAKEHWRKIKKN